MNLIHTLPARPVTDALALEILVVFALALLDALAVWVLVTAYTDHEARRLARIKERIADRFGTYPVERK